MEFRGEGVKSDMGDWRGEQRFFQRVSQARNQLDKSALSAVLKCSCYIEIMQLQTLPQELGHRAGSPLAFALLSTTWACFDRGRAIKLNEMNALRQMPHHSGS